MKTLKQDCGCEFEVDKNDQLIMPLTVENLNLECQKTWDLIGQGLTIGGFQIDSHLGQKMSKDLKPDNIDHLAALISIMRPSCLKGVLEDGKSIAQHFIDRKNKLEEAVCPYLVLNDILKDTFYLSLYQEDLINIAKEIAGFSLQEADILRKSMGKKKPELMVDLKIKFLNGCKNLGKVTEKEADEIFSWLESSQRYSFNKSHAYSYAMTTYLTMYAKAHVPLRFYKSWLNHSSDKIKPLEEIKNLVIDARQNNIDILNPDLREKNKRFVIENNKIRFGLGYIKGVGEKAVESLITLSNNVDLNTASWIEILFKTLLKVNQEVCKHILAVGCLDFKKISRERLLFEHDIVLKLTKKEIEWIVNNIDLSKYDSILPILTHILSLPTGKGYPISNKNRKNIIKSLEFTLIKPPFGLIMNIERQVAFERSFLGTELSVNKLDSIGKETADTTVKEFIDGKNTRNMKLIVEINQIKTVLTKNKEEMSFINVGDQSGQMDVVLFPSIHKKYNNMLFENNLVLIIGKKGNKGDNLVVDIIKQA